MPWIAQSLQAAQDQRACIDLITQTSAGFNLAAAYRVAMAIRTDRIAAGATFQ